MRVSVSAQEIQGISEARPRCVAKTDEVVSQPLMRAEGFKREQHVGLAMQSVVSVSSSLVAATSATEARGSHPVMNTGRDRCPGEIWANEWYCLGRLSEALTLRSGTSLRFVSGCCAVGPGRHLSCSLSTGSSIRSTYHRQHMCVDPWGVFSVTLNLGAPPTSVKFRSCIPVGARCSSALHCELSFCELKCTTMSGTPMDVDVESSPADAPQLNITRTLGIGANVTSPVSEVIANYRPTKVCTATPARAHTRPFADHKSKTNTAVQARRGQGWQDPTRPVRRLRRPRRALHDLRERRDHPDLQRARGPA